MIHPHPLPCQLLRLKRSQTALTLSLTSSYSALSSSRLPNPPPGAPVSPGHPPASEPLPPLPRAPRIRLTFSAGPSSPSAIASPWIHLPPFLCTRHPVSCLRAFCQCCSLSPECLFFCLTRTELITFYFALPLHFEHCSSVVFITFICGVYDSLARFRGMIPAYYFLISDNNITPGAWEVPLGFSPLVGPAR